ncbi:MAG: SPFH domain-containing protein [Novosphingobium sp.]
MSDSDGPKRGRKKKADTSTDGGQQEPQGEAKPVPGNDAGATPADRPAKPPRNPWAQESADPQQRRSASIDDILRQRPGRMQAALRGESPNWAALALIGVVAAWLSATSIHVLAQGERGIVTTFGRYSDTIGPGLHFTLPWPVQQVLRREVGKDMTTLLPEKEAETLMPTRDGELIDVRLQVRWRVSDFRQFAYAFPDGEAAIRRLADAEIRAAAAEFSFDEIRSGQRQGEMQQRVAGRMQRVLSAMRAGVTIAGVEVTDNKPPVKLAETFKKIGAATDEAAKNHERALTWAAQSRYSAQAEAEAFDRAYAAYQAAPGVWRTRMYYETMDKVLSNNPVVLDGKGGTLPPKPNQPATPAAGGR